MIAFGSSLITISVLWAEFKNKILEIKTPYHYVESNDLYEIFIVDMNVVYTIQIHRGDVPISSDISQVDNDIMKAEFESDYKAGANVPFSSIGISTTSTSPRNDHEMVKYGLTHAHINSLTDTNPYVIDFQIPDSYEKFYLWGVFAHAKDFGDDDYIEMQIVDKDDILGYGTNTVLKEYDQVWCQNIAKSNSPFFTPDGAPGEILGGLYARVLYYTTDIIKTDVKIWLDYILTIKN